MRWKGIWERVKRHLLNTLRSFFNIEKDITSPTFVLMKEYDVSGSAFQVQHFVHVDAYRLEHPEELLALGLGDALRDPETVTVIEWADKLKKLLASQKNIIWIRITLMDGKRIINSSGT